MKTKIAKLKRVLKRSKFTEEKQAVVVVYLTIVLLGNRIPETAKFFNLEENKVQAALTCCGVKLKKDKFFLNKIHSVAKDYMFNDELNLVA